MSEYELKYEPITNGLTVGAVLKPDKIGTIQEIAIRSSGEAGLCEWISYINDKGVRSGFAIDEIIKSISPEKYVLNQLDETEYQDFVDSLYNLPKGTEGELWEIFEVIQRGIPL